MYNLPNITVKELYMLHGKEMEGYMKLESIMQEDGDRFLNKRAKPLGLLQFGQVALLKKYMVRNTPKRETKDIYHISLNEILV